MLALTTGCDFFVATTDFFFFPSSCIFFLFRGGTLRLGIVVTAVA
jgi:hypothetical protein